MESIKFITVEQFKTQTGTKSIKVLRNEKSNKLFLSIDNGDCYKVQQDIDNSKEMKFLIKDGNFSDACLVNVDGGATEQFSL